MKKSHSKEAEKKKSDHLLIIQNIPERKEHQRKQMKMFWDIHRYSNEFLIKKYNFVKKKLERVPTKKEMEKHGKISTGPYWDRWGSWTKFLSFMGDGEVITWSGSREKSNDEIIQEFKKLKKKLNKIPRSTEFKFAGCISRRWGSWTDFLLSIGENPPRRYGVSLNDIISEYWRLKKLLNKKTSLTSAEFYDCYLKEMTSICIHNMSRVVDMTYNEFLFSIGEEPYLWDFVDKEILSNLYIQIKNEKGDIPFYSDLPFSQCVYQKNGFNTYNDFVISMGDYPKKPSSVSKKEIINDVKRVWKELKHQPTMLEYDKYGKYHSSSLRNKSGVSWATVMISLGGVNLGYLVGGYNKIPREKLEKEYIRVRDKVKHPPTQKDFNQYGKYSYAVYARVWKSFSNARRELEIKYFDKNFDPEKYYRKLLSEKVSKARNKKSS